MALQALPHRLLITLARRFAYINAPPTAACVLFHQLVIQQAEYCVLGGERLLGAGQGQGSGMKGLGSARAAADRAPAVAAARLRSGSE